MPGSNGKNAFRNGGFCLSAVCRQECPAFTAVKVFRSGKISVDNKVSVSVGIAERYPFFRLCYVFIIVFFLPNLYIINFIAGILKVSGSVRVTYPTSADSKIQDDVKRLVKGRRIGDFALSFRDRVPVVFPVD